MEAIDVIVDKFLKLRSGAADRQIAPWVFVLISAVGSVLKELELVPQTYFSSSRNVVNVYFVKLSWGWTLGLLTPFVLLSSSGRSAPFLWRRLLSLVVATAVWYICIETFLRIEDMTGSCYETDTMDIINEQFTSKVSCREAGFYWHGYDISGHSFILAYSALFIMEETAPMASLKSAGFSASHMTALKVLYVALNLIVIISVWMFACTSVYFHDILHKLLGTLCGLLGWYLTYRVWYLKPLSPGLPLQGPVEKKQHA